MPTFSPGQGESINESFKGLESQKGAVSGSQFSVTRRQLIECIPAATLMLASGTRAAICQEKLTEPEIVATPLESYFSFYVYNQRVFLKITSKKMYKLWDPMRNTLVEWRSEFSKKLLAQNNLMPPGSIALGHNVEIGVRDGNDRYAESFSQPLQIMISNRLFDSFYLIVSEPNGINKLRFCCENQNPIEQFVQKYDASLFFEVDLLPNNEFLFAVYGGGSCFGVKISAPLSRAWSVDNKVFFVPSNLVDSQTFHLGPGLVARYGAVPKILRSAEPCGIGALGSTVKDGQFFN